MECWIPNKAPPGCDSSPICPIGIPKKQAVLAFFTAMSLLPTQASSMRTKGLQVGTGIDHRDTHPDTDLDRLFLRRREKSIA